MGGLCCCLTLLPTQRTPVACDSPDPPAVLSFLPLLNGLYLLFCSEQCLAGKCPILWATAVTVEVTGSINLKQSPTWAAQPSKGTYPRETLLLQICDALRLWERQRALAVCQEKRTAYGKKPSVPAASSQTFLHYIFLLGPYLVLKRNKKVDSGLVISFWCCCPFFCDFQEITLEPNFIVSVF